MARPILLVLRALGLGDLATTVPALRALRRAHPRYELVLAAPAPLATLAHATGAVDRLHVMPSHVRAPMETLNWHGRRPRLAVNLHGRGPESHRALLATGPERLVAFASAAAGHHDGPQWNEDEHEVARWCRLVRWTGIDADDRDLALPAPPVPSRLSGAVVVHPGASGPERCWPVVRYAAVARALARGGHQVVVTGSRSEAGEAAAVAGGAELPQSAMLAGRTDLATLGGVIANARLVVCGDTGVAHLATAYGTPSVVLFGPVSPARWGPPPDREQHVALWRGPDGLADIGIGEVCEAAHDLLAGTARDAASAR
jgi:ADP-heptose:LPS heptosyltransferase